MKRRALILATALCLHLCYGKTTCSNHWINGTGFDKFKSDKRILFNDFITIMLHNTIFYYKLKIQKSYATKREQSPNKCDKQI